jgi:hypothetical protein
MSTRVEVYFSQEKLKMAPSRVFAPLLALLLTSVGATGYTKAAEDDRVVNLPGAPADLGYDMFAG